MDDWKDKLKAMRDGLPEAARPRPGRRRPSQKTGGPSGKSERCAIAPTGPGEPAPAAAAGGAAPGPSAAEVLRRAIARPPRRGTAGRTDAGQARQAKPAVPGAGRRGWS